MTVQGGISTFMLACQVGRLSVVEYLFSTGKVNVDAVDNNGCTALHHCCWEGHPRIAKYLISIGANEHALNKKKCRPVDVCKSPAMRDHFMDIVKAHAMRDRDVEVPDTAPDVSSDFAVSENSKAYRDSIESFREFVAHYGTAPDGEPDLLSRSLTNGDISFSSQFTSDIMSEGLEPPIKKDSTPPARRLSAKGYVVSLESVERDSLSPLPDDAAEASVQKQRSAKRGISDVLEKATAEYATTHPISKSESTDSAAVRLATKLLTPEAVVPMSFTFDGKEEDVTQEVLEPHESATMSSSSIISSPDRSNSMPVPTTPSSSEKVSPSQRDLIKQVSNPFPAEGVVKLVWRICKTLGDVLAIINLVLKHPEALHSELRDEKGLTPLQCAILSGHVEVVEFMVEKKLYLHATDPLGDTPLHKACITGNVEIAKTLLKYEDVKVNAKNNQGCTPLHIAVAGDFTDLVKFLVLTARANIEAKDAKGRTPVDMAVDIENQDLVDFLETVQSNEVVNMADGDRFLIDDGLLSPGLGHAVSAQRALMGSPKVTRKLSSEDRANSAASNGQVLLSPEELWSAKVESKGKTAESPKTPPSNILTVSNAETPVALMTSDIAIASPEAAGSSTASTPNSKKKKGTLSFLFGSMHSIADQMENEFNEMDENTTEDPSLTANVSLQAMVDDMERKLDEMDENTVRDPSSTSTVPLSITEVCHGVVFEEELDGADEDDKESVHDEDLDLIAHQHKLVSLLGYSNSASTSMDEGDFSGGEDIRMTGVTPPPDCMADDEREEWMYLSRALLQARQMEEETQATIRVQEESRVLNTRSLMQVDVRWLFLMGSVCRVLGSTSYKTLAKRFYQWKYSDVGGPAAVGLFSGFYNRSNDDPSPSRADSSDIDRNKSSGLAARMTPALLFALHVLGRHARVCQRKSRRAAVAKAWAMWASLRNGVSSSSRIDNDIIPYVGGGDDLGSIFDMERTMDSSMAGSVFPGLQEGERVEGHCMASVFDMEDGERYESEVWVDADDDDGKEAQHADDEAADSEEGSGDEEGENEGGSGDEGEESGEDKEAEDLEEIEGLTGLGPLPSDLEVLFKPNEVTPITCFLMKSNNTELCSMFCGTYLCTMCKTNFSCLLRSGLIKSEPAKELWRCLECGIYYMISVYVLQFAGRKIIRINCCFVS